MVLDPIIAAINTILCKWQKKTNYFPFQQKKEDVTGKETKNRLGGKYMEIELPKDLECFKCKNGNLKDKCYCEYRCIKCDLEYEEPCYDCGRFLCPYKLKGI